MRILVVCGAGASSTFVAQRLRRAAAAAGLDWDAAAGMESSVADSDPDLVLVGPHLSDRLDAIRDSASVPVAVLPDDVFADRDGSRTLVFARSILAAVGETPKGTP
ncbi:PTS sugar transporter subunit IIB [Microbacterium sp. NPDC058269]|jgi:PTS system cellobiose-specific IIB component|uniref:PTS sugar transporter subunit IIB n=1 Tax=Microbacterium sp. NPDC058269 TaxID=3346414 RepID=UPI0036DAF0F5